MFPKKSQIVARVTDGLLADLNALGPMPSRPMTDDERRGFNWALGAMMLWGKRIEREGLPLGGVEGEVVPITQFMAHSGRMVTACAEALHIEHGRRAA